MARFGSVITAMVTPFRADGSFDGDGAAHLARWLVRHGSDGLVVSGTTGESPTLTEDEKRTLWRVVREAVDVPVIAGSTGNDTAESIRLTKAACDIGCDAVLTVTPYYSRPSQAGIAAHFRAVADAAGAKPVVLYDIPVRTGRKVASDTILGLAHDVPNIVGLKDAGGQPGETARVIAAAPAGFDVYSGDDHLNLALLAVGAVGVISVAAHWCGEALAEMAAAFAKGDVEGAREVNATLLDSYAYESSDAAPNPIPAKVMMHLLDVPVGQCRLPIGPPPAGLEDQARRIATELGLLGQPGGRAR